MRTLILLLVLGLVVAFLSLQNTTPVTLLFLTYTFPPMPLYYVIIGSMLVGTILAYSLYLIRLLLTTITINDKNKRIKNDEQQIVDLTKKIHQLELENARGSKEDTSL